MSAPGLNSDEAWLMNVRGRIWVWMVLGLCACSVDERELALGSSGGSAGASGAAGQSAGASGRAGGVSSEGGAGGESADGLVNGCADLDTDGVADCTTTLVKTPSFTDDVSGWSASGDAQLRWDAKNALSDRPSGSARLSASTSRAAAVQCTKVDGRQLVIAYAQVLAESVDGETPSRGQLHVEFFESQDCTGDATGFFETPPSTQADVWTTVQAGGLSEEGAASLAISLVGLKPADAVELEVYFDNVMVKSKDLD